MVHLMNQRHIYNPVKQLRGSVFAKIVDGYNSLTIFAKKLHRRYSTWFKICLHEHNFTFNIFRRTKFMESWWNFLSFYLKENKIWGVSIKVFQQSRKPATLLACNRRLQHLFQCISTSNCFFYRTTPVAASIKELFLLPRHDNSSPFD